MNTTAATPQSLALRNTMRASLLALLCAGSLMVCSRAQALEADAVVAMLDMPVAHAAPDAAAPRAGRLVLAMARLGERVMRLAPWHHQAAMQPSPSMLVAVADDSPAAANDTPSREAWNLKASPDPLVALIQMSRPTLRLSGGPEISLRVLGGVGVTLRSQF